MLLLKTHLCARVVVLLFLRSRVDHVTMLSMVVVLDDSAMLVARTISRLPSRGRWNLELKSIGPAETGSSLTLQ